MPMPQKNLLAQHLSFQPPLHKWSKRLRIGDQDNTSLRMRSIPLVIASLLITITTLNASQPTAKTFFSQSNSPTWCDPFALTMPSESTHQTDGLRNVLHVEPFYWRSTKRNKLGEYFGYHDDSTQSIKNCICIDADASSSSLYPQDIIHDSENSANFNDPATSPLSESISFSPYIEQYGALIANSTHIGEHFVIHTIMPWLHVSHILGMTSTLTASQTVEGASVTASDFFEGTLIQDAAGSPDQQDALVYGKLKDKQSCSGLGDISLVLLGHLVNNEKTTVSAGGILTLPTSSRPTGHYLFEPLLGTGGHVIIGAQLAVHTHIAHIANVFRLDGLLSMTHRIGLDAQETRSASFQFSYDNGVDAQFGRYALAGKQHSQRLFPLINALTQPVNVSPGSATDIAFGINLSYHWLNLRLMYRFSHNSKERVTPVVQWPSNTFAVAAYSYKQTTPSGDEVPNFHTFDVANDSTLLTNALHEENLLFDAAATPAQNSHTLGATLVGAPLASWPHTCIALRGHLTLRRNSSFGLPGFGLSAGISHTF